MKLVSKRPQNKELVKVYFYIITQDEKKEHDRNIVDIFTNILFLGGSLALLQPSLFFWPQLWPNLI